MKKIKSNLYKITAVLMMAVLLATGMSGCGRAFGKEVSEQAAESAAVADNAGSATSEAEVENASSEDAADDVASKNEAASLTVTAIKGGAADAFVLISDSHVTIIDTGLDKKADKLVEFLKSQNITRVDELIITHFDKDHVGGADHIINEFEVGTVYTTYQSKDSDDITSYMEALSAAGLDETVVSETLSYEADGVSYTIYPPESEVYGEKISNNSSLVIRVSVGENSMLFAGDAEYERLAELLDTEGLESTILKVPHHGRYNANSEAFIKYISPKYAIITSSSSEPEDQQILDILQDCGAVTYLTRNGNISIVITEDSIQISQ